MDLNGAAWRKSSYSGNNGGDCVQVAAVCVGDTGQGELCAVRDSKNPSGPMLAFGPPQWRRFAVAIKAGRFDAS